MQVQHESNDTAMIPNPLMFQRWSFLFFNKDLASGKVLYPAFTTTFLAEGLQPMVTAARPHESSIRFINRLIGSEPPWIIRAESVSGGTIFWEPQIIIPTLLPSFNDERKKKKQSTQKDDGWLTMTMAEQHGDVLSPLPELHQPHPPILSPPFFFLFLPSCLKLQWKDEKKNKQWPGVPKNGTWPLVSETGVCGCSSLFLSWHGWLIPKGSRYSSCSWMNSQKVERRAYLPT